MQLLCTLQCVLFANTATFPVLHIVNRHNCQIWISRQSKKHEKLEKDSHILKTNVHVT